MTIALALAHSFWCVTAALGVFSGHHPEDRGQPQSEARGLLRISAQSPAVRGGSLAPPGHGRLQREGEVRARTPAGGVEVRPRACCGRSRWPVSCVQSRTRG